MNDLAKLNKFREEMKQLVMKHNMNCFFLFFDKIDNDIGIETNICPECVFQLINIWHDDNGICHSSHDVPETIN